MEEYAKVIDYKIVLLGESSVGKSSILERIKNNSFNNNKSSTIGAAFISKKIIKDDILINLQIWDTAGQERFNNLTPLYYRNSNLSLVVFDLKNIDSLKKAEYWINELRGYIKEGNSLDIVLVGNKCDLVSNCSFEDKINEFIQQENIKYFPTSAKDNLNINELFQYIIENIDIDKFGNQNNEDLIDLDLNLNNQINKSNNCQC